MIISTESELAAFCARAAAFDAVAVDTEFLRERTFHPRLCLIQVGTPDESVAIDPIALEGYLDPLAQLFVNPKVLKVFHACTQDMEVLLHTLGVLPAPIFDTQVAAAFLGERLQIAYNGLVQAFCGVTLPKTESLTDWSRRPLTDQQIEYALDDVRYLIKAYGTISERLETEGRLWWVLDEMRPLMERSHYETDRREAYKRVKRINSCTRKQMAIARELAAWREGRAEKLDIPRKWVMSDEVLVALVKRAPREVADVRSVRGTEQLADGDVHAILMAVDRGRRCPADRLPPAQHARRALTSELESVVDLMYALLRLVAERSGVATAMIASRDDLADYIDHPERSPLRDGWRFELVGTRLDDLLSGNMGLTVKDRRIEIL
ncbi:ribonuclease D [Collinsella sp. An307]|uniref:ribonuclease D n=1 Tax=Collinsella sp. An307 TaxID=1965630 RepID=UPI000B39FD99|nr:ribonuclease D [Collinsella sp. An307]OUO22444.1 ribonuclease D [Collinsella sp. An307]